MVQRIGAFPASPSRHGLRAGLSQRFVARLLALVGRVEPVELIEQRFNFLPRSFRWRGDLWRVRSVARVWEQSGSGARPARRYFEVLCGQSGSCVLFQDLQVGTWHVSL